MNIDDIKKKLTEHGKAMQVLWDELNKLQPSPDGYTWGLDGNYQVRQFMETDEG